MYFFPYDVILKIICIFHSLDNYTLFEPKNHENDINITTVTYLI